MYIFVYLPECQEPRVLRVSATDSVIKILRWSTAVKLDTFDDRTDNTNDSKNYKVCNNLNKIVRWIIQALGVGITEIHTCGLVFFCILLRLEGVRPEFSMILVSSPVNTTMPITHCVFRRTHPRSRILLYVTTSVFWWDTVLSLPSGWSISHLKTALYWYRLACGGSLSM